MTDAPRLAHALAAEIALALGDEDVGLTLLGNSFGALLAFETALALERLDPRLADRLHLVVSGFRSPSRPPCDAPLHRLPRSRLLAELRESLGVAGPDLDDLLGEAQELALRADLKACETYRLGSASSLAGALTVIRLTADPSVSDDELCAWSEVCAGQPQFRTFEAGHFPWSGAPSAFASLLVELMGKPRSALTEPTSVQAVLSARPRPEV